MKMQRSKVSLVAFIVDRLQTNSMLISNSKYYWVGIQFNLWKAIVSFVSLSLQRKSISNDFLYRLKRTYIHKNSIAVGEHYLYCVIKVFVIYIYSTDHSKIILNIWCFMYLKTELVFDMRINTMNMAFHIFSVVIVTFLCQN